MTGHMVGKGVGRSIVRRGGLLILELIFYGTVLQVPSAIGFTLGINFLDSAISAISPQIDSAISAISPKIDSALSAISPKIDSAFSAISPVLGRATGQNSSSLLYLDEIGSRDQTKCYDDLGCISITDEWFDLLHRPLNLLPFDRDKINTRFILYPNPYNKTSNAIEVTRDVEILKEAGFDPKKRMKFVIHGFIDTGFSSWVVKLCQQLALSGDYNVFAVDWGGGSLPLYTQATANTRLVGLEVANFITFLIDNFNCDTGRIHLIGHSLGSHVAGYAGEKIPGLGRITGLDPAEPYFQYMPEFVRLDPSDAKFVDVIHSDGRTILLLGYGMQQPCGHVDFYPNDGKEQPGCALTEIPLNLVHLHGYDEVQKEIFACNHHRAIYYFTESVTPKCQYVGHVCEDYEAYQKGQCYACGVDNSNCAIMGIDADKYHAGNKSLVRFYLTTGKVAPFCVHHYRVNLQMAYPPQAAPWLKGKLKISIIGSLAAIQNIDLSPTDIRVDHGTNITFLVQNTQKLGNIEQVLVNWTYNNNYLDIMSQCWMFFCNNKLFIKKIQILDIDDPGLGKSENWNGNMCGEEGTKYTGINSGGQGSFERPC